MKKFKICLGLIILITCGVFMFKWFPLDTKDNYTVIDSSAEVIDNNKVKSDYSVLVQSPIYDAVVQLDKDSKEIKVKVLDDSNIDSYDDTNKYVNLTQENISFLKENANELLKEFENSSMLDKYSLVSKMLKDYDTNINMGDLINIAMSYLK